MFGQWMCSLYFSLFIMYGKLLSRISVIYVNPTSINIKLCYNLFLKENGIYDL